MKHKTLVIGILVCVLAGFTVPLSYAQKKKNQNKKMPSQEEMMARWQAAMTPGDAHKKLEYFTGVWDVEAQAWMNSPDSLPSVSKGTAEYKMILGGRFVQQEFSGEMMQMPFKGIGFTGYDNVKKKYTSFWIDEMSTAMSVMEGSMNAAGTILTLWGKMDEPSTGEKNKDVKYVIHIVDKDTHVFEVYDVKTWGDKKPTLKLTYTRKN